VKNSRGDAEQSEAVNHRGTAPTTRAAVGLDAKKVSKALALKAQFFLANPKLAL